MSVRFYPPQFTGDIPVFISSLMASLQEVFFGMEDHIRTGTIVLWPTGKPIPVEYLKCDGTTDYDKAVSPGLWRMFAATPTAPTFKTPSITGPTGTVAVIRV